MGFVLPTCPTNPWKLNQAGLEWKEALGLSVVVVVLGKDVFH